MITYSDSTQKFLQENVFFFLVPSFFFFLNVLQTISLQKSIWNIISFQIFPLAIITNRKEKMTLGIAIIWLHTFWKADVVQQAEDSCTCRDRPPFSILFSLKGFMTKKTTIVTHIVQRVLPGLEFKLCV